MPLRTTPSVAEQEGQLIETEATGAPQKGVVSENGIYGHSRFCNTDFDDKLACLNLSGV
ncbi:TPA: hypothetical protein G8B56_004437 [Salmonella enterica]|uniref:Uncharacterized protein n=1 Tax=Salmonella enterica TaxID=28901 RepID=A0A746EZ04_SALER|nr:hypothetical protein [Salmonella enterica]